MDLGTPAAAKVIGAVSLVLVAAGGWLVVLGPKTSELAGVQERTVAASSQNQVLAAQLVSLQDQAVSLAATRRTAGELAVRFPPTADQPGLFRQVTTAASDAGILPKQVTDLSPTAPTFGTADEAAAEDSAPGAGGSDGLARQTVTVTVEASYSATQKLLARLEQTPRAFLVTSVSVATGASPSSFTSTVTGDMFVMPPAGDIKDIADQLADAP
jgi:hypothetical protein